MKSIELKALKLQLRTARNKYKPKKVRYLLIAEAPPNCLDRFFYYEHVPNHDYLFLALAQAFYPKDKSNYILGGRNSDKKRQILLRLKADGIYLLDLSEVPKSVHPNLKSNLANLIARIKKVMNRNTKIILIKSNVYSLAFDFLKNKGIDRVADVKIPFPAYGQQQVFQEQFRKAINSFKS